MTAAVAVGPSRYLTCCQPLAFSPTATVSEFGISPGGAPDMNGGPPPPTPPSRDPPPKQIINGREVAPEAPLTLETAPGLTCYLGETLFRGINGPRKVVQSSGDAPTLRALVDIGGTVLLLQHRLDGSAASDVAGASSNPDAMNVDGKSEVTPSAVASSPMFTLPSPDWAPLFQTRSTDGGVWAAAFSPCDRWLAVATGHKCVEVYDLHAMLTPAPTGDATASSPTALMINPESPAIRAGKPSGFSVVPGLPAGVPSFELACREPYSVGFSADGSRLAAVGYGRALKVWVVGEVATPADAAAAVPRTFRGVASLPHPDTAWGAWWLHARPSQAAHRLASLSCGSLYIWGADLDGTWHAEPLLKFRCSGTTLCTAAGSTGALLAVQHHDTVEVWLLTEAEEEGAGDPTPAAAKLPPPPSSEAQQPRTARAATDHRDASDDENSADEEREAFRDTAALVDDSVARAVTSGGAAGLKREYVTEQDEAAQWRARQAAAEASRQWQLLSEPPDGWASTSRPPLITARRLVAADPRPSHPTEESSNGDLDGEQPFHPLQVNGLSFGDNGSTLAVCTPRGVHIHAIDTDAADLGPDGQPGVPLVTVLEAEAAERAAAEAAKPAPHPQLKVAAAAREGTVEELDAALDAPSLADGRGPGVNAPCPEVNGDRHPLLIAAGAGNWPAMYRLLERGADATAVYDGQGTPYWTTTALEAAVKTRTPDREAKLAAVRALIAAGADVDTRSVSMDAASILHWAVAIEDDGPLIATLAAASRDLEAAEYDCNKRSVLYSAAHHGHTEAIKSLVAAGANLEAHGSHGSGGPLSRAIEMGKLNAMATLLALGADPEGFNPEGGTLPLVLAAQYTGIETRGRVAEAEAAQMVGMLLKAGANPNAHNHGWTALHAAAKAGNVPVTEALLLAGADRSVQTAAMMWPFQAGVTPLAVAEATLADSHPVLAMLRT